MPDQSSLRVGHAAAVAVILALVVTVIVLAAIAAPEWLFHPLGACHGTAHQVLLCKGQNFWSGIGSDWGQITDAIGMLTLCVTFWHRHNCHQLGCWRLVRHSKTHCRKHEVDA